MCQSLTGSYIQGPWCQGIYSLVWEQKIEFWVNPELLPFIFSDWQSESMYYTAEFKKKRKKPEPRGMYILIIIDI